MKPALRSRFAVVLAMAAVGLMSVAGVARADTYVGRLIAEDLFDHLKFSGRIAVWPVDAAQARAVGLTPASARMLADKIRAAVQQIGAAKGLTFVEREAISKVFQERQFAHNAKDSDFEALAHQANADALVLINLERESPAEITVSARLVSAKGAGIGQILATSKIYEVAMTETAAKPSASVATGLRTPLAPPPTVQPPPVNPGTVTPIAGTWTNAPPPVPPPYAVSAYTVTPAAPYAYAAAPPYYYAYPPAPAYVRPYFARPWVQPRLAVAYGRWGWRR